MVKFETIGMIQASALNPILKLEKDVKNYSFITVDDVQYLVLNVINGDDSYREDVVIKAGECLNGYNLKYLVDQKLFIDGKHITGGIDSVTEGTILVPAEDGTLVEGEAEGVHLVVTDINLRLTEKAVKAKIVIA